MTRGAAHRRGVVAVGVEWWIQANQSANDEPAIGHRAYGRYYRLLTENLNGEGIQALGGRWGGFTGSSRSFRTGYEEDGIYYALQIGDLDGKSWIWLHIRNNDHGAIYNALNEYQSEIDQEIASHTLQWETSEEDWFSLGWHVNRCDNRRCGRKTGGNQILDV